MKDLDDSREIDARLAACAPNPSGSVADWKLWLNGLSATIERQKAQIALLRDVLTPLIPRHHGSCVRGNIITVDSCVCCANEKAARAALEATEPTP